MTIDSSRDIQCPVCRSVLSEDEMKYGYCIRCDIKEDFEENQLERMDEVDFFECECDDHNEDLKGGRKS